MLITFISMGYDYISKICFDFLKRIIPHTSSVFVTCTVLYYDISRKVSCRVRRLVVVYLLERWMGDRGWIQYIPRTTT